MKLSIIMPMYNSSDIITNIKEAMVSLNKVTEDYEIILVNDGSTNNCFEEAKKFSSKKVKVVGYDQNMGKGYAIKYGFNFTKGDYIAFVDSGRDLDPKQLKDFLEIMKKEDADIVIGSKRHSKSEVHYPLIRRVMSRVYQIMNKMLFNLKVQDTQVGLKLFKREVLEKIMPKIAIKRFAFDLELLVLANKYEFKIAEAPIIMRYKFRSTINLVAVFWMLWDTAAIFYRLKILKYYDRF
ncbi:MAG: glycosyltransferase family 2 protein [archaeon]|nr:glycosyltransferase family 2 protein [archaeon]